MRRLLSPLSAAVLLLAAPGASAQSAYAQVSEHVDAALEATAQGAALRLECEHIPGTAQSLKDEVLGWFDAWGLTDSEAQHLASLYDRAYAAGVASGCDDYKRRLPALREEALDHIRRAEESRGGP